MLDPRAHFAVTDEQIMDRGLTSRDLLPSYQSASTQKT